MKWNLREEYGCYQRTATLSRSIVQSFVGVVAVFAAADATTPTDGQAKKCEKRVKTETENGHRLSS